jgi:hypothetical protein
MSMADWSQVRLELVVLFVEGGVPGAGRGHGRAEDGVAHAWEEGEGGRGPFILLLLLLGRGGCGEGLTSRAGVFFFFFSLLRSALGVGWRQLGLR